MSFWIFKSNFTRIAEYTTKYYLELINRYQERFRDDTSVLATAGVMDTQNYIFNSRPKFEIGLIITIARDSITGVESHTPSVKYMFHQYKMAGGRNSLIDVISGEDDAQLNNMPESTKSLFYFVVGLEMLIFQVDSRISTVSIQEACYYKRKTIEKAIVNTINRYRVGKGLVAKATTRFMESPRFLSVRQELGITG